MKRLLVRTLLLAMVVGLGTVAVFEAKRLLRYEDAPDGPAIARREDEPHPIPLAAEDPDLAPAADMPDFVGKPIPVAPPQRERYPAGRPQPAPQRVYDSGPATSDIPAGYTEEVPGGPASDPGATAVEDNPYGEPRRLQAEPSADAMPSGGGDPFGIRRGARSARYNAQQAAATDDDAQAADPADESGLPADRLSGREGQPAADDPAADAGGDNFAPPGGPNRSGNLPVAASLPGVAPGDYDPPAERAATAPARGDEGTGRPGERQLEGTQAPSVTIEKRAPAEIQVGKPAVFTITVRNQGNLTAQGVEVHDVVPQGTKLISTTPPAKRGPQGELIWELGGLKPTTETTLSVQLMPLAEGEIGSVATLHFRAGALPGPRPPGRNCCSRPRPPRA